MYTEISLFKWDSSLVPVSDVKRKGHISDFSPSFPFNTWGKKGLDRACKNLSGMILLSLFLSVFIIKYGYWLLKHFPEHYRFSYV